MPRFALPAAAANPFAAAANPFAAPPAGFAFAAPAAIPHPLLANAPLATRASRDTKFAELAPHVRAHFEKIQAFIDRNDDVIEGMRGTADIVDASRRKGVEELQAARAQVEAARGVVIAESTQKASAAAVTERLHRNVAALAGRHSAATGSGGDSGFGFGGAEDGGQWDGSGGAGALLRDLVDEQAARAGSLLRALHEIEALQLPYEMRPRAAADAAADADAIAEVRGALQAVGCDGGSGAALALAAGSSSSSSSSSLLGGAGALAAAADASASLDDDLGIGLGLSELSRLRQAVESHAASLPTPDLVKRVVLSQAQALLSVTGGPVAQLHAEATRLQEQFRAYWHAAPGGSGAAGAVRGGGGYFGAGAGGAGGGYGAAARPAVDVRLPGAAGERQAVADLLGMLQHGCVDEKGNPLPYGVAGGVAQQRRRRDPFLFAAEARAERQRREEERQRAATRNARAAAAAAAIAAAAGPGVPAAAGAGPAPAAAAAAPTAANPFLAPAAAAAPANPFLAPAAAAPNPFAPAAGAPNPFASPAGAAPNPFAVPSVTVPAAPANPFAVAPAAAAPRTKRRNG